ncbi:hypothetical protein Glove_164g3 [Diversispora epigaea]|uniref:BTB domain-containing protein n=1 Tax=Diversispora epigaea TaxID=1348612 RepID=A0A397IXH9_9GLOM|nr:hypothetical protein Glove_164g3 [Diversispora epigaea]
MAFNEDDANIYKVHSIILQSHSPYFKKKFEEIGWWGRNFYFLFVDYVNLEKFHNISFKIFDVIIKYIYGGKFSLEELENSIIFDLLISSNELELGKLVEHLQYYHVVNHAWLKSNAAQVYRTSYQVQNFKIIQDSCNDIIAKYPNIIFESENFHSLPEDALISILKRDD